MRVFFASLLVWVSAVASSQHLTESSKISLLTISPGKELYSTFGHSAIRVQDTLLGFDSVFNYGTFDFDTPNFYVKFTQGKLLYILSISHFDNFMKYYRFENRSVVEQELNLNIDQRRKLFKSLMDNYKPKNRYYKYDFFFDNCATRIRDILPAAFGDDFQYHYPESWQQGSLTFRNLIDLYLTHHHWSDFGIDLALGLPTDAIAGPSDYMFLPDYLHDGFESATISTQGEIKPLVTSSKLILPRIDTPPEVFYLTPLKLCWALFVLTALVTLYGYRKQKRFLWYDMIYFSILGLVGWVVFLLDHATDHIATKDNLNVLWAVPLHLPLFLLSSKIAWKFFRYYVWICLIIDLIIILTWVVFPQNYHIAFVPLILSMIIRYAFMIYYNKSQLI